MGIQPTTMRQRQAVDANRHFKSDPGVSAVLRRVADHVHPWDPPFVHPARVQGSVYEPVPTMDNKEEIACDLAIKMYHISTVSTGVRISNASIFCFYVLLFYSIYQTMYKEIVTCLLPVLQVIQGINFKETRMYLALQTLIPFSRACLEYFFCLAVLRIIRGINLLKQTRMYQTPIPFTRACLEYFFFHSNILFYCSIRKWSKSNKKW